SVNPATGGLGAELAHRVQEGIGSAYGAAADLGASAPTVLRAAQDALVDGWRLSMWVGVGIAISALVYLAVRGPRPSDLAAEDALDLSEGLVPEPV
ncbi:MAG TPA: MFS transporter, partial [Ilumatobacteraceae bacterium]|nr:MFS transporter [Ilumatobacteraceae bacterium]